MNEIDPTTSAVLAASAISPATADAWDRASGVFHPRTGEVIEFFDAEIERLKSEIAERLGFELIGHKLELYGKPIPGAEPSKREGLIFNRHAARVDVDAIEG